MDMTKWIQHIPTPSEGHAHQKTELQMNPKGTKFPKRNQAKQGGPLGSRDTASIESYSGNSGASNS